jgi:hypothetical protein
MTNQELLANGPEGWTHVDDKGIFYVLGNDNPMRNLAKSIWVPVRVINASGFRSRSDIERIVYLESVLKGEAA